MVWVRIVNKKFACIHFEVPIFWLEEEEMGGGGGMHVRAPVLLAAVVTTALLTLQVAMVHVMTGVYAGPDAPVAPAAATERKARVFEPLPASAALPVVLMHGMGDAGGNTGMKHIRDVRVVVL